MAEDKNLYPKSGAPVGDMPTMPVPEVDSVLFYSMVAHNNERTGLKSRGSCRWNCTPTARQRW